MGRPKEQDVVALEDVSFDVRPGEILGLVGQNGAGKTVLLKMIATLNEPTDGQVRVFGKDSVTHSREIRSQVGMATCDERSFYWRLTSRQNLTFFAKLCGLSKRAARQRVNVLLDLLDLMPVADRSYRVLSTGNRQRLAIARALLLDPDLLLLDEPTNSLDPIAAARLREVIQDRIAADGKRAVVITSHNLEEVQDLSSRVAILNHGRLLETDHLQALRARYASEETVTVEVRGSMPSLLLDQLKPLAVSVLSRKKDDGCSELSFRQDPGSSATHQILTLLVEAGIEVIRCHTEGSSLKDVFDRLVGGESPDA